MLDAPGSVFVEAMSKARTQPPKERFKNNSDTGAVGWISEAHPPLGRLADALRLSTRRLFTLLVHRYDDAAEQ